MNQKTPIRRHRASLRQNLIEYFSDGELRDLCFDMRVDYDDLPGQGKADKAREIVSYFERRQRIYELIDKCSDLRPNVDWRDYFDTTRPLDPDDVKDLVEAMGYRILDIRVDGNDRYFFCELKVGMRIRRDLIHFVNGSPSPATVSLLNEAVIRNKDVGQGILLTRRPLPEVLRALIRDCKCLECYTLEEFTNQLADFKPYLQCMIEDYEASDTSQFYVPLGASKNSGDEKSSQSFKPLESFIDDWLSESDRNHVTILGDFGAGKTWFCRRYAYLAAKRYLADPDNNRIPILITLREYSHAYKIKQLITDAIVNRCEVALAAGYETFARLNEAGRLLLILDGFDEMERRLGDWRSIADNFWELAGVVCPASKILLTSRQTYFQNKSEEEALSVRRDGLKISTMDRIIDLQIRQSFEVIKLDDFTEDDIRLVLEKRLGSKANDVYEKIKAAPNLRDLAVRPLLLEMIIKTLPDIRDVDQINQATLYAKFVDALAKRRWTEGTDAIPPEQRISFMQELAWEMYSTQRLSVPFSDFPEIINSHFGLTDDRERSVFLERDLRSQSYFVRDEIGNYRFAHKSFLEYFVACKMIAAISSINSNISAAIQVWKPCRLTQEVRSFVSDLLTDLTPLWCLVYETRGKSFADVAYAGGNAITILRHKGASFADLDLAATVLAGADLYGTNLSNTNLRGSCLREATLSACTLVNTDFTSADLTEVEMSGGGVWGFAWSPSGDYLAVSGGDPSLKILNTESWEVCRQLVGADRGVTKICWSPDNKKVFGGGNTQLVGWDVTTGSLELRQVVDRPIVTLFCNEHEELIVRQVSDHGDFLFMRNPRNDLIKHSNRLDDFILLYSGDEQGFEVKSSYLETTLNLKTGNSISGRWTTSVPVIVRSEESMGLSFDMGILSRLRAEGFPLVVEIGSGDAPYVYARSASTDRQKKRLALSGFVIQWPGDSSEDDPRRSLFGISVGHEDANKRKFQLGFRTDVVEIVDLELESLCRFATGESMHYDIISDDFILGRGSILEISSNGQLLARYGLYGNLELWNVAPSSPNFGQRLKTINLRMNCQGARIAEAIGLEKDQGGGSLRDWLVVRGAIM